MLGWVAFGCQKHAFSLQKVDKNGAKVDHSVGNRMHRFWLGKMLTQPRIIGLRFVQGKKLTKTEQKLTTLLATGCTVSGLGKCWRNRRLSAWILRRLKAGLVIIWQRQMLQYGQLLILLREAVSATGACTDHRATAGIFS